MHIAQCFAIQSAISCCDARKITTHSCLSRAIRYISQIANVANGVGMVVQKLGSRKARRQRVWLSAYKIAFCFCDPALAISIK